MSFYSLNKKDNCDTNMTKGRINRLVKYEIKNVFFKLKGTVNINWNVLSVSNTYCCPTLLTKGKVMHSVENPASL